MTKPFRIPVVASLCIAASTSIASAQVTTFSYQGRLDENGNPASGSYDFRFTVFDAAVSGNAVSSVLTKAATIVSNGVFQVSLDFGAAVFDGQDRWLAVEVRTNGSGGFAALMPRQRLEAAPYAITSVNLSGTVAEGQLPTNVARLDADQTFTANNTFTGKVGIGAPPGNSRLEIADTQARARISSSGLFGSVLELGNNNSDPTTLGSIDFTHLANGLQGQIEYSWEGMDFLTANHPRMRIDALGNVGIGTTSPVWPLDVRAGQAVARFVTTDNPNGAVLELKNNNPGSSILMGAINFNNAANAYAGQIAYNGSDAMTFRAGGAERMRVAANGYVGVGTVNPTNKLHVAGDLRVDGKINVPATQRWISVPANRFVPRYPVSDYAGLDWQDGYPLLKLSMEAGFVSRVQLNGGREIIGSYPLDLPDGAHIVKVLIACTDDSSNADLKYTLQLNNANSGNSVDMAATQSTGASGVQSLTMDSILFAYVNNASSCYSLKVDTLGSPEGVGLIKLMPIRICYEVSSPLP